MEWLQCEHVCMAGYLTLTLFSCFICESSCCVSVSLSDTISNRSTIFGVLNDCKVNVLSSRFHLRQQPFDFLGGLWIFLEKKVRFQFLERKNNLFWILRKYVCLFNPQLPLYVMLKLKIKWLLPYLDILSLFLGECYLIHGSVCFSDTFSN